MIHELTTAFNIAAISQFVKSVENILRHFYWALDAVRLCDIVSVLFVAQPGRE